MDADTVNAKNSHEKLLSRFREEIGETFVIAKDIRENCLKVYSLAGWEAYIKPLREQTRKLSEKILRYLHASLVQVTPDTQGRVVLPPELIEHAKIEKNIMIVGCCDYAEIWSDAIYREMKAEEDVEALLEELEDLGL